jgi:heterotetrameric sarcosine oxidase delta subunit
VPPRWATDGIEGESVGFVDHVGGGDVIRIACPHCGPRNSSEFRYAGEAATRPHPDVAIEAWRDYLYVRDNPAGWTIETWYHTNGCRQYLRIRRHTVTNEISHVAPVAAAAESLAEQGSGDPGGEVGA